MFYIKSFKKVAKNIFITKSLKKLLKFYNKTHLISADFKL